ncbi:hypothetical protein CK203_114139 [Vitis vinifera]|uniref:Uncharacterized protein n=1 Tax=Vitis vinifera TaxID=29760 RepID=A0A438CBT5_VITVI|nr:hypothetical protein CK203_114139 [Vitis vinifera]
MTEPSQPLVVPPSIEGAPPSPPLRRYETRRPPTTPGVSSSHPKKSASRPPKKKARISAPVEPLEPSSEPHPPTIESQIPSGMTAEVIIRWPMVTQPPIEGNLDYWARPFHSELCFDRETFRLQLELRDSFHLLQRYHLEHLMTPRDFFYPHVALDFYQSMTTHRVRDPTVIHFTIDGCHERYGSYTVQRDVYTLVSIEEGPTPEATSSTPPTTPGTPPIVPAASEPHPFESSIAISIFKVQRPMSYFAYIDTTQSILTQQMAAICAIRISLSHTQTQHIAILRQIQQHLGILSPHEHDMLSHQSYISIQGPPLAEQTMPPEKTTTREIKHPSRTPCHSGGTLPPIISIVLATLRAMFNLVGGRELRKEFCY